MKAVARVSGICLALALSLGSLAASAQQTTLRIFTGGQQRPDVMRQIVDLYSQRNPGIRVEVEVGGATSDQQQQYLNTVLAAKDSALDVILIDVIRPAQWAAQGWAEPLDPYLGAERDAVIKDIETTLARLQSALSQISMEELEEEKKYDKIPQ